MLKSSLTALAVSSVAGASVFALMATTGLQESAALKKVKTKFTDWRKETRNERIYIQTDKTYYKPDETVWFSAFVRNEDDLKSSEISDIVHVEFISPKGNVEKHFKLIANNGVAKGDIDLKGALGGIYKLKSYTNYQKNDSSILVAEKEITVQTAVLPRLKMKLDFDKKSYGKGDAVKADLQFTSNENTPISKTKVDYVISIDGNVFSNKSAITNDSGKTTLAFTLPKDLKSTDVFVNAKINYEGAIEAISRSVPVVLNKISLAFYPEGGDMISGVENKVAFRALNEFGKPVEVQGFIVDKKGAKIADFAALYAGMGNVVFTTKADEVYTAKITKPEGVEDKYVLPDAIEKGYILSLKTNADKKTSWAVYSFKADSVSLFAQVRGKTVFSSSFFVQKGWTNYVINTEKFPAGIAQVTLIDGAGVPRAERLVFVNEAQTLNVKISPDKQQYKPREKVTLNIRTTDAEGLPVSADLALSVVDDNLLSFADDKQGNILSKILLEPELKESVFEPNFYFDKKEAKANDALDNLLLTSGWRRYTWKQILNEPKPVYGYEAQKAVFGGKVIDAYHNVKGFSGAKVMLKVSGRSVITDTAGNFTLPRFDITQDSVIVVTAKDYDTLTQHISDYERNHTFYIRDPKRSIYYVNGIKRFGNADAVQIRGARADDAVEFEAVQMAAVAKDEKVVRWEKPLIEKQQKQPVGAKNLLPDGNVNAGMAFDAIAEFGDLREAAMKRAPEVKQEDQVLFYRSKEFPKRIYSKTDSTRADLQTTIYWNGHIETDLNGKAQIEFVTNDVVSSFRATAEGFGVNGEIGRGEAEYSTNQLLVLDAKIPSELVSGDSVIIPVFVKNNSDQNVAGRLEIIFPNSLQLLKGNFGSTTNITPKSSELYYVVVKATDSIGKGLLKVTFNGIKSEIQLRDGRAQYTFDNINESIKVSDQLTREINVVAKGFPANISLSGQDLQKDFSINPQSVVPNSMRVSLTAFPNVMTELLKGVEAILAEPYGCFEQTSSSNYPNIMVLDYMRKMEVDNPELEAKAKKLLDEGYKKLVSFETKENGYEWFGAAPAHEALTAYGLVQFEDMKKVYPNVSEAMIERTRKTVLDSRDGKGGFKRNPRALDSFGGADEDITNAYIVYSLTESGYKDLARELDALYESAKKTKDPYIMALAANAFYNVKDFKRGDEMMDLLLKAQNAYGYWDGKKHSITRSTGLALKIETTSFVLLGIMKAKEANQLALQSGVKYLIGSRNGTGSFGSTQATVMALKALTRYAEFSKKTEESGTIEIYRNGKLITEKHYEKGEKGKVEISGLEAFFTEGKQQISVRFKGCKQALPYSMNIGYNTILPNSSDSCVLDLKTELNTTKTKVGETVRLTTTLKNKTAKGQPMSVAVIGLPSGLSVQPWQMKELQDKKVFDFYETIGNNVVFYYRALAPNDTKTIALDLKADIGGTYDAPASSAYLYYTNEFKVWKQLPRVTIEN